MEERGCTKEGPRLSARRRFYRRDAGEGADQRGDGTREGGGKRGGGDSAATPAPHRPCRRSIVCLLSVSSLVPLRFDDRVLVECVCRASFAGFARRC